MKRDAEWRTAQQVALAAEGCLVSQCHPWFPAMVTREGRRICGDLNCRKPVYGRVVPDSKSRAIEPDERPEEAS